ncbi:MAG TPA: hypothetical protein VMZ00_00865 [Sporichthya sp.]|nr:hypothetical protein [Sporichthya sp.]
MDYATVAQADRFLIAQRFTAMVNRYDVSLVGPDGTSPGELVCFVEQKRMAFKEQVDFRLPDGRTSLFRFKSRSVIDLGATYDVTAADGTPIGSFKKEGMKSLLRSTWRMSQPGQPDVVGQERSVGIAVLRRVQDLIPLPFHFDFSLDGQPILSVDRQRSLRDRYLLHIHVPGLDRRLAIAMGVALDALQER